jgi:hypothetical protein
VGASTKQAPNVRPDYSRLRQQQRSRNDNHGKAEFVIQDAESYQTMLERIERVEAIEGVRRGLEQTQCGEGRAAEAVFTEMEATFGGSPA